MCEICDFNSNWKNGLEIHMTKKHSSVEQLDGNVTFDDDDMDEEYKRTQHYWKSGWLGSVYQLLALLRQRPLSNFLVQYTNVFLMPII